MGRYRIATGGKKDEPTMTNLNAGLRTSDDSRLDPGRRHAVLAALNALVASDDNMFEGGQEGFAEWAAQAARLVPYGDECDRCMMTIDLSHGGDHGLIDPVRYPQSATVTLGSTGAAWLDAGYQCHVCGYRWTHEWAVNAPWDEG